MSNKRSKNKKIQKSIAKKRIIKLFQLAEEYSLDGRINLADRYVDLARKISMRYLVPIPKELKRSYCKHCYCYLLPFETCRIRVHRGRIIIYCKKCKKFTRIPLKTNKRKPSAILI